MNFQLVISAELYLDPTGRMGTLRLSTAPGPVRHVIQGQWGRLGVYPKMTVLVRRMLGFLRYPIFRQTHAIWKRIDANQHQTRNLQTCAGLVSQADRQSFDMACDGLPHDHQCPLEGILQMNVS